MNIDIINQFKQLMEAFGIQVIHLKVPFTDVDIYDRGLRQLLYKKFEYGEWLKLMAEYEEDFTLYIIKDCFEETYISCKIPDKLKLGEGKEFLQIGPYITEPPDMIIEKVITKNQLPLYYLKDLLEYYCGIPLVPEESVLENIILLQAGYLFGAADKVIINRIENLYGKNFPSDGFRIESGHKLSMNLIEERYRCEDDMLKAIEKGNLEKAISCYKAFQTARLGTRNENDLREIKNYMIVMNTLCRKAVQRADVHSAHIDAISASFAIRIEECIYKKAVIELSKEMIRKYCLLVRNHSLCGYSKMIQNTLNFISFNLSESLSLKILAEKEAVNASYLSAQFKKEVGKTLTEYINQKRIHNSLILLATTDIPIQEVAEKVGIYDENYFSRLFKKIQEKTPKQYRILMKTKI